MSNSLVSIIIPTYNRAHLIRETLNSVLSQTYTNWECIIIDDGSTDNTSIIIEKFSEKDHRFKYIKRPTFRNKGASTCRNIGIENAKGSFLQFLDSDDVMTANKLSEQVILLLNNTKMTFATCKWSRFKIEMGDSVDFENFQSYNSFSELPLFLDALTHSKGYFPLHAYLIKKELIDKSGRWNENLSLNDDTEFLIRVFCNTEAIYFAENARVFYRWTNEDNISNYNDYQKVDDAINSWKLIDLYLKIKFKNRKLNYVEFMKNGLYINVNNSFPELIKNHSLFFKKQRKKNNLFNSIKKFLYQRFYKLLKK